MPSSILSAARERAGRWYLHLTHAARPHTCNDANVCFRSLALDITGCSVKADARGMDIGITTVGPIDEARHRVQQRLGEHALGDVADGSVKLAEAPRSRREGHDHEHAPFIADAVEHVAHRAMYGFY